MPTNDKVRVAVASGAISDLETLRNEFAPVADFAVGDIDRPDQLATLAEGADVLLVSLHRVTAEHLDALRRPLRLVLRAGVGLDSIDLAAARGRGITVINQPAYAVSEVADHAVAMLLAGHRNVAAYDHAVRVGEWPPAPALGEIPPTDELVLGLLGFGRIGRAVAARLAPSVAAVHVFDPAYRDEPGASVVRAQSLGDLLRAADLLSLHLPLTPATRGILGERELGLLPAGAVVVNASRGGLIDEDALAKALTGGRLRGAALDVFTDEPLPLDSPLRAAPRLLMSPHVAWYSRRAASRLARWSVEDAVAYVTGRTGLHGDIVTEGL
jgi:D-3-phosphoglycerate dehydrogenase / 2-oxoglutarate reductase